MLIDKSISPHWAPPLHVYYVTPVLSVLMTSNIMVIIFLSLYKTCASSTNIYPSFQYIIFIKTQCRNQKKLYFFWKVSPNYLFMKLLMFLIIYIAPNKFLSCFFFKFFNVYFKNYLLIIYTNISKFSNIYFSNLLENVLFPSQKG